VMNFPIESSWINEFYLELGCFATGLHGILKLSS
jgi:hypothetical protein